MDLPREHTIRESSHRILDPITSQKLEALGQAIRLREGTRVLDLACGKGEMLCTWARDHGIRGTGVDISTVFVAAARARAEELGVAGRVEFVHADAAAYVAAQPADVAACVGATWIGDGVPGTLDLLARGLRPGGIALVGEPYWRIEPPDRATIEACHAAGSDGFSSLPDLLASFRHRGWDVVEMMLASQDDWDRYVAAQWLNVRGWLDANPDDELAPRMRAELDTEPVRYARYRREYLGWGIFALIRR